MTILFPTDFSDAADHAFVYALKLAEAIDATINTIHVYDMPTIKGGHAPNALKQVYDEITFETFENYKDHIPHLWKVAEAHGLSAVRCNHSLVESTKKGVVDTIVRKARSLDNGFIVIGTTGASGLKEVFLGSVAAEVIEHAPCPVLAIPFKAEFDGTINRVGFATEFDKRDIAAYASALQFAKWFEASMYVVHVDTSHTHDYTKRMDKFLAEVEQYDHVSGEIINHISVEQGIAEYVNEQKLDVLAMRIKRRNFLEELFTYSMTKKLANHLTVPVLGLQSD